MVLDRPWIIILAALAVVAAIVVRDSRIQPHHVRVSVDSALSLTPGADVQAAGVDVGKVKRVIYEDGRAIVELGIGDEIWPLPRGTTAEISLGSTSGSTNRRVVLHLGPHDAPKVPDGGVIGAQRPERVELDDVLQGFGPVTRSNLGGTAANMAKSLRGHEAQLNAGVHELAPALSAAAPVMGDLARSQRSLSRLLRDGDAVMATLARHRQQVGNVIASTGEVFDAVATRSREVRATLDAATPALQQVVTSGRRLRPTLTEVTGLFADLRAPARRLAPLGRVATPTLTALRRTAPEGVRFADAAIAGAPAVARFLNAGTPVVRDLASVVAQAQPIAHCVGAYAPEIGALASNWASYNQQYDATGHILRGHFPATATAFNDFPENFKTADAVKLLGTKYAGLRPPGWLASKPRFMPECGVGPDAVDPAKDWEDR